MIKKEITTKNYGCLIDRIAEILTEARSKVVREINKARVLAFTNKVSKFPNKVRQYWEIGREVVEFEQKGKMRAEYGEKLLIKLSADMTAKFSKGFSERNLRNMWAFYLNFPIWQTLSAKYQKFHAMSGKSETLSRKSKDKKCQTLSDESQKVHIQSAEFNRMLS
ncbi:MAG: hypothetical protein CVT89_01620 [Candidatus Altiarchaeales archaeon HGW-Altiarchaeales-2]|nr:MAG: hypothetical protein CVT89_01620 [Candidatus Altiarchaeales archaeon HGW-Altiarchaeales-2]